MKLKIIPLIGLMLLILSGCAEKKAVVIQKSKGLPVMKLESTLPETSFISNNIPGENSVITSPKSIGIIKSPQQKESTSKTEIKSTVTNSIQSNQSPSTQLISQPLTIIPGEVLVYQLKWNFLNVGKIIFACKEDTIDSQKIYHIMAITLPQGIWTRFGYGYNRFDSYIDAATNLPYYFYDYSASASRAEIINSKIDQNKGIISTTIKKEILKNNSIYSDVKKTTRFKGIIYDSLSAFYVLRSENMWDKNFFVIPVGTIKTCNLYMYVLGQKTQKFPGFGEKKYFDTFAQTNYNEGIFRKGKLYMGITANKSRIPLFLKGSVPLGTGYVNLIERLSLGNNFPTNSEYLTNILNSSS
jgi:hypothetical protein